jgi:hypothetical protein
MRGSSAGLVLIAAFVALFAVLTIAELVSNGPSPLALVSLFILVMFAIGLMGAFRRPPPE